MTNQFLTQAQHALAHGKDFPYDAPDDWYKGETSIPPQSIDKAHATARGVMSDLTDRRGIKWELDKVDPETREEIVRAIAEIIRLGMAS